MRMTMEGVGKGYTVVESSVLAVKAGADIILKPSDPPVAIDAVMAAVQRGEISAARIRFGSTAGARAQGANGRGMQPDRRSQCLTRGRGLGRASRDGGRYRRTCDHGASRQGVAFAGDGTSGRGRAVHAGDGASCREDFRR